MSQPGSMSPGGTFAAYQEALSRGHQAYGKGDLRAALAAYRTAAELAGERPLPHVLVGRTQLAMGKLDDALRAFDEALALAPTDAGALAGKAEALRRLGRHDAAAAARAALERASLEGAAAEEAASSRHSRAEVLAIAAERAWQEGRADAAINQWTEAARAHAADGHVDAALDVCQRALLADPGASRVHLEMSRHYFAAGLAEQAVERLVLLGRLVQLEPDQDLRRDLAELARRHGDAHPPLAQLARQLDEPMPG